MATTGYGLAVWIPNPFEPYRVNRTYLPSPVTVRQWLQEHQLSEQRFPLLCLFNGRPLLQAAWAETVIRAGDTCTLAVLPAGGRGKSNPIAALLSIALILAAPMLAGAIAPGLAAGTTIGQQFAFAALKAGISIAGTALVNAVLPAPKPNLPGATASPSPSYSLQAQGNNARLMEPIPVQYGRFRMYPDFAAVPWADYDGKNQFLYQTFCLGVGEYDIERIRIGETDISSFREINYQIVPPGGVPSLFNINITSSPAVQGQQLKAKVITGESYSTEWDTNTDGWVGPFPANPSKTAIKRMFIDIAAPAGFYLLKSSTYTATTATIEIQARIINDAGTPTSDWIGLGSIDFIGTQKPDTVRTSFELPPPSASGQQIRRIEVRIRSTHTKIGPSGMQNQSVYSAGQDIYWIGLRSEVDGPLSYPDVTLILMKMLATDNLTAQQTRQVNLIQTRKIPLWSQHTGWTDPVPTSSLTWAFADILRNPTYGAGLQDTRLPLEELSEIDTDLNTEGLYFNGVFDTKSTIFDALQKVTRPGQGMPLLHGGQVRIIRDIRHSVPVMVFTPRNIVQGSIQVSFAMPGDDTSDAVIVEYMDPVSWKPAEASVSLPDSASEKPVRIALFGCTDLEQAKKVGWNVAASNRYRRIFVQFRTELEGMIPIPGDLIAVGVDLLNRGQGGEVLEWDATQNLLTLSEPLTWTENANHYLLLSNRDGSGSGPFLVNDTFDANATIVRVMEPLTITPYTGNSAIKTRFTFGANNEWATLCRVMSIRPVLNGAEISAVIENNIVHEYNL